MNELCFVSGLTSSEWASWVQTIGALVGLAIAIAVPYFQNRASRTAARLERLQTLDRFTGICLLLLKSADEALTASAEQMRTYPETMRVPGWQAVGRHIGALIQTLRAIPLDSLHGAAPAKHFLLAIHALDNVVHQIEIDADVLGSVNLALAEIRVAREVNRAHHAAIGELIKKLE